MPFPNVDTLRSIVYTGCCYSFLSVSVYFLKIRIGRRRMKKEKSAWQTWPKERNKKNTLRWNITFSTVRVFQGCAQHVEKKSEVNKCWKRNGATFIHIQTKSTRWEIKYLCFSYGRIKFMVCHLLLPPEHFRFAPTAHCQPITEAQIRNKQKNICTISCTHKYSGVFRNFCLHLHCVICNLYQYEFYIRVN